MHRRRLQNRRRTQDYRARAKALQQEEEQRIPCHNAGHMDRRCTHCGALTWRAENKAACCCNGQVVLPPLQPPPEFLRNLLLGDSAECKHFRENIRGYNSALAFASLGANEDILPPGIFCFRISGEVHHRIGHLHPDPNNRPRFAQLYIHDTDNEAANRMHWNSSLREDVLLRLQDLLHQVNPYVKVSNPSYSNLHRSRCRF